MRLSHAAAALLAACLGVVGCNGSEPTIEGVTFVVELSELDCTVEGPNSVEPGDYWFLLRNSTDQPTELSVRTIADGNSYQDVVAAQGDPGTEFDRPPFVGVAMDSFEAPPEVTLDEGDAIEGFKLVTGEHMIRTWSMRPGDDGTRKLWLCAPLTVVAP